MLFNTIKNNKINNYQYFVDFVLLPFKNVNCLTNTKAVVNFNFNLIIYISLFSKSLKYIKVFSDPKIIQNLNDNIL